MTSGENTNSSGHPKVKACHIHTRYFPLVPDLDRTNGEEYTPYFVLPDPPPVPPVGVGVEDV
jgi:hypothetical protein